MTRNPRISSRTTMFLALLQWLVVAATARGDAGGWSDTTTPGAVRRKLRAPTHHRNLSNATNSINTTTTASTSSTSRPCTMSRPDAMLPTIGYIIDFLTPSYYESCLESLQVDTNLMLQHIQSLRRTFQQYFCFHTIANDVWASDPIYFQPELGYSLFYGPEEGQVNIELELLQLEERVNNNTASLATFWDIQTIFNKLYDAHVDLPQLTGVASLTRDVMIFVFPHRNLNATSAKMCTFTFSYTDTQELILDVSWDDLENQEPTEHDRIRTLNGLTPYDFFYQLAIHPANVNPYQSIGARMNVLFQSTFPDLAPLRFRGGSRPSDFLPERFPVVYESGQEEVYYTGIAYDGDGIVYDTTNNDDMDMDMMVVMANTTASVYDLLTQEPTLDQPGSAYLNYLTVTFQVQGFTSNEAAAAADAAPVLDGKQQNITGLLTTEPRTRQMDEYYDWDVVYNLPDPFSSGRIDAAAFTVHDEYAVLKIQDFSIAFDDLGQFAMVEIWSNFSASCKARGVKKAIIDISSNTGGSIISGNALAVLMFPFMPKDILFFNYDMNYNKPMEVYNQIVAPIIAGLVSDLGSTNDTALQTYMNQLPANYTEVLFGLVQALSNFCCGGLDEDICSIQEPRCQGLFDLRSSIESLQEFPVAPQFRSTVVDLIEAFEEYNPFNVLDQERILKIDPNFVETVIRGGVPTNLTNRFSVFTDELYYYTVARSLLDDWEFDEYVMVSDGLAGSTTCIFSSMAVQLRNNAVGVRTPLTTITYGGSKWANETTIAGFPASVQGVKIEYPLITSGLLYMLQYLLPTQLSASIQAINVVYQSVLPVPPFFAESLPNMPVYNYYSRFMDPGAAPLQYVKIVGDLHIPQIYTKTTIFDSSDLQGLYKEAARLGFTMSEPTDQTSPPETISEDDPALPLEESEDEGFQWLGADEEVEDEKSNGIGFQWVDEVDQGIP